MGSSKVTDLPAGSYPITVARLTTIEFTASFMPVASMNLCPYGYYNHPEKDCFCAPGIVDPYLNKISGPLLNPIDIHVEVFPVPYRELIDQQSCEKSESIRRRVIAARQVQELRYAESKGIHCNAQMTSKQLRAICILDETRNTLLKNDMEKLNFSARAYDRILKMSRTIANLDACESIKAEHLAEAIQYRSLDRPR